MQQCVASGEESMEERQKENKEEKRVQPDPLCHTCQACNNHTQEHTVDLQYLWKKPTMNYWG